MNASKSIHDKGLIIWQQKKIITSFPLIEGLGTRLPWPTFALPLIIINLRMII